MRKGLSLFSLAALLLAGCTHPSEDNIRLRMINQDLTTKVDRLTIENDARQRTIEGLEKRNPTVPILPPQELKKLWVTAGLSFGRLTGGADLDPKRPGDEGLNVYICPTDENGDLIQAAGSFVIEAFDLAEKGDNRIGSWTWDATAAKSHWRSFLLERDYALACPWQKTPRHADITVRVVFTDELTHLPFNAETVVHVNLPPTSPAAPTSAPSP